MIGSLIMNFSLKLKLIFTFLLTGLVPVLVTNYISITKNSKALEDQNYKKLISVRDIKRVEIENLFTNMAKQVKTLSNNPLTVTAMKEFKKAFQTLNNKTITQQNKNEAINSIKKYYTEAFLQEYKNTNNGNNPGNFISDVDNFENSTLYLQKNYISNNENPLGSKHQLTNANDGSNWSKYHEKYHPSLKSYLEEFGYYDIFLVDSDTGHIIYSVFKELDFATSLETGPYKNTNFSEVFKKAKESRETDSIHIVDLEKYFPSYELPAGFIASPIFDNGKNIGVLIFQIPVEKIDAIMTNNQKWVESGFGDTGETYLVGSDLKMRSLSRFIVEDKKTYLENLKNSGHDEEIVKYMEAKNTSTISQTVSAEPINQALKNKIATETYENYQGKKVIGAYRSVNLLGLTWAMVSEIQYDEVIKPVKEVENLVGALLIGAIFAILLIAFWVTKSIVKPMTEATSELTNNANNLMDSSRKLTDTSQIVSAGSHEQAASLQQNVASMAEISGMVEQTADSADATLDSAKGVTVKAKQGSETMNSLVDAMQAIKTANSQLENIANVISTIATKTNVINDIVFKTQLLSFNASIEAARAGKHGRGFAVVAEEVGILAQTSGKAAAEIRGLIESSQKQVEGFVESTTLRVVNGEKVTLQAKSIFDEISSEIDLITSQVESVSKANSEQKIGINQISTAMNQIDESNQLNAQASQKVDELARGLETQGELLNSVSDKIGVLIYGVKLSKEINNGEKKSLPIKNSMVNLVDKESTKNLVSDKETSNDVEIDSKELENISADDSSFKRAG